MTTEQLDAFFATAGTGSMKQAAMQLFISQPALKKRIDSLESELGVLLFHRTKSGCRLTDTGQKLEQNLKPQYIKMQNTIYEICHKDRQMRLRLCQAPHLTLRLLDKILSDFVNQYKTISIDRSFVSTDHWQNEFFKGSIDLFPVPATPDRLDEWHRRGFVPLYYDKGELICVMSPDHPLADHSVLSLQDLQGYRVYTETILLTLSGLDKAASALALTILPHPSAVSRYDMTEQVRNGVVYIHDSGMAADIAPLIIIPLTGVDYGRYLLLQNDTSEPLRLLKDYLIHRGFEEQ